jgi:hypothetical protein
MRKVKNKVKLKRRSFTATDAEMATILKCAADLKMSVSEFIRLAATQAVAYFSKSTSP